MPEEQERLEKALTEVMDAARAAGDERLQRRFEAELRKVRDPGFGMYQELRAMAGAIDKLRYYIAFKDVAVTSVVRDGRDEDGTRSLDEWLAIQASRLTQAATNYADRRGWT